MKGKISTFCHTGGCVEVSRDAGGRLIVNSTDNPGTWNSFSEQEWEAFIAGVKAGEFDLDQLPPPTPPSV